MKNQLKTNIEALQRVKEQNLFYWSTLNCVLYVLDDFRHEIDEEWYL